MLLPADAPLPSEYETLTATLAAAYTGPLTALQENAQRQDITYLGNKTGWDARIVALAASAAQFSQVPAPPAGISSPAPTPTPAPPPTGTPSGPPIAAPPTGTLSPVLVAAPPAGTLPPVAVAAPPAGGAAAPTAPAAPAAPAGAVIPPEFYYALFRAGLPANADLLYRASPQSVQAVWQQAIAGGVIPASLQAEIPAALATYQTLSATNALSAKSLIGVSALKDMLQVSLTDPKQQQQFAQLFVQHQGDTAGCGPRFRRPSGRAWPRSCSSTGSSRT